MTDISAADKLSRAKAKLVMYHPFFATIVCNLPIIEDRSIPTMATNGKRILYNPEFVDTMTLDNTMAVLCHEVGHCMFNHMFRRGTRNAKRWNIAGDYVINDLIVSERIGTLPEGALIDANLVRQGDGTADGVYALLPEESGDDDGGYAGTGIDLCEDAPGDAAEQAQAEAEMRVAMAQAARVAQAAGKLSAGVSRLVEQALAPKVDWRVVLRNFLTSKAKIDLSYARPNRRFMSHDLIMPSLDGNSLGELAIAVDCSGSIGAAEIASFAAEITAIHEDCRPAKVHVIYFDSSVSHYESYEPDDSLNIRPHGGGGTAFSPIFQYVSDNGIDPAACVVLTDLWCSDFGPQPHYPVLWVSNDRTVAPWGEVVKM